MNTVSLQMRLGFASCFHGHGLLDDDDDGRGCSPLCSLPSIGSLLLALLLDDDDGTRASHYWPRPLMSLEVIFVGTSYEGLFQQFLWHCSWH